MPNVEKLQDFFNKFKIPLGLGLIGIVLIIGGLATSQKPTDTQASNFPKESIVSGAKQIVVDVSGSVNKPGVYKLDNNSRIGDAIKLAGGLTVEANQEYVSKYLNLAQKLSDGIKIYIPFTGEQGTVSGASSVSGTSSQGSVSINSASQSELEALPGIGPVTANKIISSRPYLKIDDLLSQKIVSKSTFEKISSSLVVY